MSTIKEREQDAARERLLKWINPGDTLWTIIRHRSDSGMYRVIQVVKIEDNEPTWLGYNVAELLGWGYDDRHEGVKVRGTGMDMGFHLVYKLSYALFGKGYECLGEKCPSNWHVNNPRNPARQLHQDGYALKHRWL